MLILLRILKKESLSKSKLNVRDVEEAAASQIQNSKNALLAEAQVEFKRFKKLFLAVSLAMSHVLYVMEQVRYRLLLVMFAVEKEELKEKRQLMFLSLQV